MKRITEKEYAEILDDYKGIYHGHQGILLPRAKGKRCCFIKGHGTDLFIEGVSLEIVKE